jgi:hypothetical protein
VTNDSELPPDPDLDDLPDALREREGPFTISGVDLDTGERPRGSDHEGRTRGRLR